MGIELVTTDGIFALDGGEWEPLEPLDGVADSSREQYRLEIEHGSDAAEAPSVMVRVSDASGNLGGDMWRLEEKN